MSKVKMHLKEYFSHEQVDAHEKILRKKIWSFVFSGGEKKNLQSMLTKAIIELPSEYSVELTWCDKTMNMPDFDYLNYNHRTEKLELDKNMIEWANNVYSQFLYEYSKINS